MKDIKNAYNEAQNRKSCKLFTGNEDYSNITDLMYSPQGIEFCTKNNLPSLKVFEEHKSITSELEEKGVFINAGNIKLRNLKFVWLVGKTTATITVDNPNVSHQIVLMHGAKAHIIASNYAVVFIHGKGEVTKKVRQHAIIL